MTRIGISVALACMLLLALSGVAAAHGPSPYGWPAYSPYGSAYSGYTNGYGYGYATGYSYSYRVGYGEGYYGQYGCRSYCYPTYTCCPVCPRQTFNPYGGGYTRGDGHSWGMGGW